MNTKNRIKQETKQWIKEYVTNHYNVFGFYPHNVAVNGNVYSYDQFTSIVEEA